MAYDSVAASATKTFEYRSVMPATVDAVWQFHDAPRALPTLMPPPLVVQIVRDDRVSLTEGEIEFRLWFGPVPVRWLARHEPGETPTSFVDRMVEGPMALWEHQHTIRAAAGGAELIDHIMLAHRSGWRGILTRLMFDGLLLRFLFVYRHWRTRRAVAGK